MNLKAYYYYHHHHHCHHHVFCHRHFLLDTSLMSALIPSLYCITFCITWEFPSVALFVGKVLNIFLEELSDFSLNPPLQLRWLMISSRLLHQQNLLSVSSFRMLFSKQFLLITWSWTAILVHPHSLLIFSNFSLWYYCSLFTIFLSKLHENCPYILFPCHVSSLLWHPLFILFLAEILSWGLLLVVVAWSE
jgi:hypothetical protein